MTVEELRSRLEEAGQTLYALSVSGVWPDGYRSRWPDVAAAIAEGEWSDTYTLPRPSPRQISEMDEVDQWINMLVPNVVERRILRTRSFINPRTGRAIVSWRRLAKMLKVDHRAVMRWYDRALKRLADRLSNGGPPTEAPRRKRTMEVLAKDRAVPTMLSFSHSFLKQLDAAVEVHGGSRSKLMRRAFTEWMTANQIPTDLPKQAEAPSGRPTA